MKNYKHDSIPFTRSNSFCRNRIMDARFSSVHFIE